ncbi:MAG: [FeFe] hydrogenase H-cluster radical SAM maturase HydG [Anaerovoracaceae bacterium]
MGKYNSKSMKSDEFISDAEILRTIDYAEENVNNIALQNSIISKAENCGGLDYKEAAILLGSKSEEIEKKIFALAEKIKEKFYGNRIVLFAPLYLSNYCINGCTYCPYHAVNKDIKRKKLSQKEIEREVIALQDMGHKRLALETGEHPTESPIEYVLESIKTIYSIKHDNGAIRRVNVNIAATTIENYKKLKEAEIGTYILFQETYHKDTYEKLHPTGPKSDYAYHTEAMDRAMEAGIDDVGCGVLFGLNLYKYDFIGLLMHAKHLEYTFGCGPHTISVPRIRPADDINLDEFQNGLADETFKKIVAILRIAAPYAGIIMSTRESKKLREECLHIGVSQISGGSRTSVGGYAETETEEKLPCVLSSSQDSDHTSASLRSTNNREENSKNNKADNIENTEQFEVDDKRTLAEVVDWLIEQGFVPSFCTACYREGRTGDRFMQLVKSGQIANICQPNALITLKEYLEDYASLETKEKGEELIAKRIEMIPNEKVKKQTEEYLKDLRNGKRDFRF